MTIQQQVCSLEQAKRLKELGIEQEKSHFMWYEVSNGDDEGDFEKEGVEWVPVLTQYDMRSKGDYAIGPLDSDLTTSDGEFCSYKPEPCKAFTVAELGVMLIIGDDTHFVDCRYNEHLGCWQSELTKRSEKEDEDTEFNIVHKSSQEADTEAEVRAAMLIHLLETNLITAETCNQRLSQ